MLMLSCCTGLIFTILFNHVQHVYYVYAVPYMQVATLGKIVLTTYATMLQKLSQLNFAHIKMHCQ